jgi:mannose-1-phosphate guanylyltransferase
MQRTNWEDRMRALLLAGGKATRLRPLTEHTPKAMTPLLGRPFLEHLLAWLVRYDIRDVTLLLGFLPGPIRGYFRDGHHFGVKLRYVVEDEPLGSGGAIKQLERELDQTFLVLNADIFTDIDLSQMLDAHRAGGAEVSIALTRVDDPSAYGVCDLGEDGFVRRFVEKPKRDEAPSDLINAGVWFFEPDALARIAANRFTMVEQDLFPTLATNHRLYGHVARHAYWMDAGTPQRYLQLQRDLLSGRAAGALAVVQRPDWPGLVVQTSAGEPDGEGKAPRLGSEVVLSGPIVLGPGVEAGDRGHLEGPLTIGARSILGSDVQVTDSILWDECRIDDGAIVRSSVLAKGCVVGAGVVLERCILGDGTHIPPGERRVMSET